MLLPMTAVTMNPKQRSWHLLAAAVLVMWRMKRRDAGRDGHDVALQRDLPGYEGLLC